MYFIRVRILVFEGKYFVFECVRVLGVWMNIVELFGDVDLGGGIVFVYNVGVRLVFVFFEVCGGFVFVF